MQPRKIIVMRHGESLEDIDKSVYAHTADLDIALSENGRAQSVTAGKALRSAIGKEGVHFYISPGLRLRQTYEIIRANLPDELACTFSVETLIMKQFWGDVTIENRREIEIQRYKEGVLVYRFPNGESGAQLVERFRFFAQNLRRRFTKKECPETIVILTHGFEMRVFLMVWFEWSVEYFERLANPKNCEMAILHLKPDGSYALERLMRLYDPSSNPNHIARA